MPARKSGYGCWRCSAGRTKTPTQVAGGDYRLTTSTQTPDLLEPDSRMRKIPETPPCYLTANQSEESYALCILTPNAAFKTF